MRPIILKLLKQEPVTQGEWQDLFYSVHLVCLWDEKGPAKLRDALKEDIMDFIKQAQQVIINKFCKRFSFMMSQCILYLFVFG